MICLSFKFISYFCKAGNTFSLFRIKAYKRFLPDGMNYLAHICLSGANRHIQIGNFVGDAVKGKGYLDYPEDFRKGILLHRRIDDFSDHHPLVKQAVAMGRGAFGRYSAVVTDIFFDYFLAVDFREYNGISLRRFTWGFYGALVWNYRYLPSRFQGFLWHFILTDRLGCYASLEGIHQSLKIMAEYRGLQVNPVEAIQFLSAHREELQAIFQDFFPELQQMCKAELDSQILK